MTQRIGIGLAALIATSAGADVIFVAPGASGSGASWADPASLASALASAGSGDEVWAKAGSYALPTTPKTATFSLAGGAALYGSFVGDETSPEERDIGEVRSGWEPTSKLIGDDHYTVLTVNLNASAATTVDGFYITGGKGSPTTGGGSDPFHIVHGAGLYTTNSATGPFTLANSAFVGNEVGGDNIGNGGGAWVSTGTHLASIENCLFEENRAAGTGQPAGGGAYVSGESVVRRCLFDDNESSTSFLDGAGADGGGLAIATSSSLGESSEIEDTEFQGNISTGSGGALRASETVTVLRCTFVDNHATGTHPWVPVSGSNSSGGGAISSTGVLTVEDSSFVGNTARWCGGAMRPSGSSPQTTTVKNCEFTGNSAGARGGAILCNTTVNAVASTFADNVAGKQGGALWDPTTDIWNCVFLRNEANDATITDWVDTTHGPSGVGGAVYTTFGGTPAVLNSLFVANEAEDNGGAIYSHEGPGEFFLWNSTIAANIARSGSGGAVFTDEKDYEVKNCIIWDNEGPALTLSQIVAISGAAVSVTYTDLQGSGGTGTGNLDVDPEFRDPLTNDYRVKHCSPVRDAGTNNLPPASPLFPPRDTYNLGPDPDVHTPDLDLKLRVYPFGTDEVDMGAYEFPCVADWNGDGTVDSADSTAYQASYAAEDPAADLDCDGNFTFFDLLEFQDAHTAGC